MGFVTDETDLSVREFYHTYRKQLPKIVMVNQGFYDDTGNDTFSMEQVFRLHKTTSRKRVLVQSFVGKLRKTYSMSINFPGKFCVETNDGQVFYDKTLLEVVRDHALPVKVRLSRDQGVKMYPDMNVKQTFDEISFLCNDIHQGVMSSEVIKIPLSDKVRFTVVTGIQGQSQRRWEEFAAKLTKETKGIDYSQEQGLEDIAQYNEEEVTPDTKIETLEPVIYTNLLLLMPGNNTFPLTAPKPLAAGYHEDVYEDCGNYLKETTRAERKSLIKSITDEIASTFEKRANPKPSVGERAVVQKPLPTETPTVKPKIAPKPFPKPAVAKKKSTGTKEIPKDPTSANGGQDAAQVAMTTKPSKPAKAKSKRPKSHSARKVYDPEEDYDVVLSDTRRKTCTPDVKGNTADYYDLNPVDIVDNTGPHVEPHVENPNGSQTSNIYANTSQMAIISPLDTDESVYMNQAQLEQSRKRSGNSATNAQAVTTLVEPQTAPMTMKDNAVNNLSKEELTQLTVDEVGEYLRLLHIDGAVQAFRKERVDGRMLQQLNADLLKQEFNLTAIQILRLQNFVKDGHIPK